ncbi:hypothetical protein [Janthinobacterium sp. PSPC2-1]
MSAIFSLIGKAWHTPERAIRAVLLFITDHSRQPAFSLWFQKKTQNKSNK